MRTTLTARERRGLIALATATLLCLGVALWVRSKPQSHHDPPTFDSRIDQSGFSGAPATDTLPDTEIKDTVSNNRGDRNVSKRNQKNKKKKRSKENTSKRGPVSANPFEPVPGL